MLSRYKTSTCNESRWFLLQHYLGDDGFQTPGQSNQPPAAGGAVTCWGSATCSIPALGMIPQLQGREIQPTGGWILCTHVSIQSPFVIPELVGKDLQWPHDLVHLEQQVHIFLLVNPWKRRDFVGSGLKILSERAGKPRQDLSGHQLCHWDSLGNKAQDIEGIFHMGKESIFN